MISRNARQSRCNQKLMKTPEAFEMVSAPESMPSDSPNRASWIPALEELREGSCREFTFRSGAAEREAFLVCSGGQVYGYLNACPHTGAPLNWLPNRFLTEAGDFIVCALHGALFRPEDGLCISGPCHGLSLESVPMHWENGEVILSE